MRKPFIDHDRRLSDQVRLDPEGHGDHGRQEMQLDVATHKRARRQQAIQPGLCEVAGQQAGRMQSARRKQDPRCVESASVAKAYATHRRGRAGMAEEPLDFRIGQQSEVGTRVKLRKDRGLGFAFQTLDGRKPVKMGGLVGMVHDVGRKTHGHRRALPGGVRLQAV